MLEPDLTQAAAFLGALTGTDGWTTTVTFQTLCDLPVRRPTLAGIINGSLTDFAEEAERMNQLGAGIFVTVQGTNGRGRKTEDIILPRAVFIDADDHDPRAFALPPSITVQTPNGMHAYWLLDGYAPIGEIPPLQRRLAAYYHSDRSVCDLSRVMRIPGYAHCKGDPMPVTLTHANPEIRYPLATIIAAHPVVTPAPTRCITAAQLDGSTSSWFAAWADEQSVSTGQRNRTCYAIAATGFRHGLSYREVEAAVLAYQRRADRSDNPFTLTEARSALASASRRNRTG